MRVTKGTVLALAAGAALLAFVGGCATEPHPRCVWDVDQVPADHAPVPLSHPTYAAKEQSYFFDEDGKVQLESTSSPRPDPVDEAWQAAVIPPQHPVADPLEFIY